MTEESDNSMNIVNVEQLGGHKTIVMTGRYENVQKVAKTLVSSPFRDILSYPQEEDYFMDYPALITELQDEMIDEEDVVVITTQSKEFLDCLLESNLSFVLATVRQYDQDNSDTYRLRVLTKEEALQCRRRFDMELRA